MRLGRVTSFDEATGLGTVEDGDGVTFPFHCVEIADGTRSIELGAGVAFSVRRKLGAGEAVRIVTLP